MGYNYSSMPNFNAMLAKAPLYLWHGWVITSHGFMWMELDTHSFNSVLVYKISVSKRGRAWLICSAMCITNSRWKLHGGVVYWELIDFGIFWTIPGWWTESWRIVCKNKIMAISSVNRNKCYTICREWELALIICLAITPRNDILSPISNDVITSIRL